ncbi:hypothetical protein [Erwinia tasmaniensis]|uniref:hypothetical protein n=1 Tax=Erwinia tasmaniensis TaxID=338565 RepID=UPI003A4DD092
MATGDWRLATGDWRLAAFIMPPLTRGNSIVCQNGPVKNLFFYRQGRDEQKSDWRERAVFTQSYLCHFSTEQETRFRSNNKKKDQSVDIAARLDKRGLRKNTPL